MCAQVAHTTDHDVATTPARTRTRQNKGTAVSVYLPDKCFQRPDDGGKNCLAGFRPDPEHPAIERSAARAWAVPRAHARGRELSLPRVVRSVLWLAVAAS